MVKTIYVPTLNVFERKQDYTEPYRIIQYTGSEDIIKALHGFIEGLVSSGRLDAQSLSEYCTDYEYRNARSEKLIINEEDDEETVIHKLCNFVNIEYDFNKVKSMLEYSDCEIAAWYTLETIEIV